MSNDAVPQDFGTEELYTTVQGYISTKNGLKHWVNVSKALGVLLINDVLRVAGRGSSDYNELALVIPLDGVFLAGSVDQVKIVFTDIELLYRFWKTDPATGAIAWATRRRGKFYLTPYYLNLLAAARWNVEYLENGCDEEVIEAFDKETYYVSGDLNNFATNQFYCPPDVADGNNNGDVEVVK